MNGNLVKRVGVGLLVLCVLATPMLVFGAGLVPCGGVTTTGAAEPECTFAHVIQMIDTIIDFLLVTIALPISALLFAWAGFLMLTAAGDEGKIKQAKGIFGNVFVGLILALAGWLIINLIVNVLTGNDLNSFLNKQP